MSDNPADLLKRIEVLESQLGSLSTAVTYAYIALLSIPLEIRRKDPDFANSEKQIKAALDKFYLSNSESDA